MILNPNFTDYYEHTMRLGEKGCCLLCPDAHLGCLCFECKCRQCAHYDVDLKKCSIAVAAQDKWEEVNIEIDEVVAETEKAYCVKVDTGEIWVPKSLAKIEAMIECAYPDGTLSHWQKAIRTTELLVLPKWLAVEKKIWDLDEFDYWDGDEEYDE